jgi:hypothetical protein
VCHRFQARDCRTTTGFSLKRGPQKELLSITVRTLANKILQFDGLHPSTTIRDVKLLIESEHNVPAALQTLNLLDKSLDDQRAFDQCGITNGTVVTLVMNLRKPMIYLFGKLTGNDLNGTWVKDSTGTQNIEVRLSLDRAWELAVMNPSMKISSGDYVQSATWSVDANSYGRLLDRASGQAMSCLFWDGL